MILKDAFEVTKVQKTDFESSEAITQKREATNAPKNKLRKIILKEIESLYQ